MDLDTVPSEDEIGGYIPLERPSYSSEIMDHVPAPEPIMYSDDEVQNHSTSDDSEDMLIGKNKLKREHPSERIMPSVHAAENSSKIKKYTVWSDMIEEEAIENQFIHTKFFGGSRGNESYNHRMKYFTRQNVKPYSNDWQKNSDCGRRKKSKARIKHRASKKPLVLPEIEMSAKTIENLSTVISKNLNEPKTELIERVINALGKEKAIEIYKRTKEVEQTGGILTLNGTRRRTSGGVYLKLVKDQKLPRKEYEAIFCCNEESNQNLFKPKKRKNKSKVSKNSNNECMDGLLQPYEWEIPNQSEESDPNILKNPPPSPVHHVPLSTTNTFSLIDRFPSEYCTSSHNMPLMESNSDLHVDMASSSFIPTSSDVK